MSKIAMPNASFDIVDLIKKHLKMTNNKYFFIGIGGIGMSSIAQYLYEKENTILGYDASENKSVKILKKGIEVIIN